NQGLLVNHATMLVVERETGQLLAGETAREDVAPPLRKSIARVDHQSGGRDRRNPDVIGVFHPLGHRGRVDRGTAAVIHTVADHRPAVVAARLHAVQLVSALRTVLGKPDVICFRVNEQALRISVPVAPYLWQRAGLTHEGIIDRYPAIVMQADRGAVVSSQALCRVLRKIPTRRCLAIAHRYEEVAVAIERQSRTVMTTTLAPYARLEDLLHPGQPVVLEAGPDHRGCALGVVCARLGIADVQQPVGFELRV